ncbi:MAG: DNA-directed RNA polymerase subunit K [Candidatus Diapherotrites archaeon]|uniref:DNA-directed RNA polymerase subunit Rpo6 n=1 Tax=Candidatus Iainarchaeum sp. TaxID=3101447 RepID=A0A939C4K1_9ARCH|nr:DNA-directed RNA polymerase subunit K [Candidatus Diapherotrites archaeon]
MSLITRFERARLISARALQLALGAPPLVKPDKESKPYDLAKVELEQGVLPMVVLRRLPNGRMEEISV